MGNTIRLCRHRSQLCIIFRVPREDPVVARWLKLELARPPRARSLIVTLWGDALAPHGGELWLASLFALLAPFGINERLARTSVYRLSRDGWVAARPLGRRSRYRLTAEGSRRFARAYQRVYTPPSRRWDGRWEVLLAPPEAVPAPRRGRLRDELAWSGFAPFAPGVFARPAPGDPVPGLLEGMPGVVYFLGRDLPGALGAGEGSTLAGRVGRAWRLGELALEYRRFHARFSEVASRFAHPARASDAQAFLVRTLLVHEYRRVRLRDPQLPPALLPAGWPGGSAYALCADFYRRAAPLAEAHLERTLAGQGERLPPASLEFHRRFA
jgi:phenylacetic acid degradation operon negative regulatory protein